MYPKGSRDLTLIRFPELLMVYGSVLVILRRFPSPIIVGDNTRYTRSRQESKSRPPSPTPRSLVLSLPPFVLPETEKGRLKHHLVDRKEPLSVYPDGNYRNGGKNN